MKCSSYFGKVLSVLSLLAAVLVFWADPAQAATRTWDNGAANLLWGDEVNWDGVSPGNGIPVAADTATFGATGVGNVGLNTTTQTISALSITFTNNPGTGYTFSNGTLNLNTINNTFGNGTIPVISANVTDQSSAGLTINHSTGDCSGFTINGQIAIANTSATALQVVGNTQRTGVYTLGSTTSANTVAGGVSINSRLNGGVTFQGIWNITGNLQMINGSSNDNGGGHTKLAGAISIGGNLISAPTAGNSANPCGIDISASSDVRVTGDMLLQGPSTFAPSIRILQPMRLGGNINVYDGVLGVSVTDPFLNLGTGAVDTSKAVQLGATTGALNASISINTNAKTLNNPITVQSGSTGQAILASGATGTGTGNKVTYAGAITLNKGLSLNANNTAGAILDVTGKISGGQYVAINNGTFAGTVTLGNPGNDYSGGTIVNNGLLQVNALGALGGSGRNVTVNGPGVVALGYTPGTTIQADLLSRIVTTSTGAVALTANSSENFDFSSGGPGNNFTALSLGAVGTVTYTGTLTPNAATYRLGGGGSQLTFNPAAFTSGNDLVINGNGLTGTVDFAGLSKTFGAITISGGTTQNGTLTGASFAAQSGTVSGNTVLAGAGAAMTKTGAGTTTLSGSAVHTFTGGLTVNAGTLAENFANLAAVPNNNLIDSTNVLTLGGGTLNLTGKNNTVSSQTFASTTLTASRSSTITLARTGTGTMTGVLGPITRNTGSLLNFSATPDTSNIIATTTTGNDSSGILGPWATYGAALQTTPYLRYVTVNGSGQIVPYAGATTTGQPTNLSDVTSATTNYSFGATPSPTLTGPITANTLSFAGATAGTLANAGNSITLNGLLCTGEGNLTISGTGNIVIGPNRDLVIHWNKASSTISSPVVDNPGGASAVTLNIGNNFEVNFNGVNSFSGGLTVYGGSAAQAQMNYGASSFGSGPVTFSGVRVQGSGTQSNSITCLNGSRLRNGITFSGPITLMDNTYTGWSFDGTTVNLNGDISGPGGLTQEGGSLYLRGSNTYTGATNVNNGGTMYPTKPAALYNADTTKWIPANISVQSGATLRFNVGGPSDSWTTAQVGTLLSQLTTGVNNNGMKAGSNFAMDLGNASGTVTFATNITDSTGPGGGTINLVKYLSAGSAALELTGTNTYSGKTTVYGTIVVSSLNSVSSPMASSSLGRPTTVANGTLVFGDSGGGGGTGGLKYAGTGETTDRVIYYAAQGQTITLDQSGTGLLKFTGGFTYNNSNTKTITLQGSSDGTGQISAAIPNLGTNATPLNKNGTGAWTLSGANAYNGITTINGGVLQFAKAASLYNADTAKWIKTNIIVNSGGTLALNVGGTNEFNTGNVTTLLTNLGGAVNNNGLRAGSAIAFDTTNASSAFEIGDTIANTTSTGGGAIGVTKLGANALVLSGTNSYTGATTVKGGRLTIASTGTINTTNGVTINGGELNYNSSAAMNKPVTFGISGGTISGTGTINVPVAAGTAAILSPGNSPGTQAYTAGLTWSGGGTYLWEINDLAGTYGGNPGWDEISVTGGLTLLAASGNEFNIDITGLAGLGTAPTSTTIWNILSYDNLSGGFDPTKFLLTSSGFAPSWDDGVWSIRNDPTGRHLQLAFEVESAATDIPEPATLALLGLAVTGLGGYIRRRRTA